MTRNVAVVATVGLAVLVGLGYALQPLDPPPKDKPAEAEKPASQQPSGSSEALAEQALGVPDQNTGATFLVYESVLNPTRIAANRFSEMRAIIFPLGVVRNDMMWVKEELAGGGKVRYTFSLLCYHPAMELQAMQALTRKYADAAGGKFVAQPTNVSRMSHQKVEFDLDKHNKDLAAEVAAIGSMDSDTALPETYPLSVTVPAAKAEAFEKRFTTGTLQFEMRVHYRSKDVKRASFSWTETDLRKTTAFKQVESGGGAFVDASQVEQVMREIVSAQDATFIQDPGVPSQLVDQAQIAFNRMLQTQVDAKVVLTGRKQAEEIERKLLAGTGLTAEQFKPITVMWEVLEDLNEVMDHKKANEKLDAYYNKDTNKDVIKASVGAGVGPFSASVGYEKEMTHENVKNGYFKTADEYKDFRAKHTKMGGLRPVITPRGLKLMEKSQFVSNVGLAVSAVAYYPVDQRKVRSVPVTCFQRTGRLQMFPVDTEKRFSALEAKLARAERNRVRKGHESFNNVNALQLKDANNIMNGGATIPCPGRFKFDQPPDVIVIVRGVVFANKIGDITHIHAFADAIAPNGFNLKVLYKDAPAVQSLDIEWIAIPKE